MTSGRIRSRRSSRAAAGRPPRLPALPGPVVLEALTGASGRRSRVLTKMRLSRHSLQDRAKPEPEDAVLLSEAGAVPDFLLQDVELLAEGQVLHHEVGPGCEDGPENHEQWP